MPKRVTISMLLILGGFAVAARGQATQPTASDAPAPAPTRVSSASATPAKDGWQDVVDRFAHALVDSDGDPNGLTMRGLLAEHVTVRAFGSQTEEPDRLRRETSGATVLGVHAYAQPPMTLAADIATDFGQGVMVPEDLKRKMVPDDAAMTRANRTARLWLDSVLDFSDNQPVAVIVLWRDRSHLDQVNGKVKEGPGELMFVCLKVQQSNNIPRIKQLVFGDPLTAMASASD
jgi:hypothetical protein